MSTVAIKNTPLCTLNVSISTSYLKLLNKEKEEAGNL
jgi:hypothetical protein